MRRKEIALVGWSDSPRSIWRLRVRTMVWFVVWFFVGASVVHGPLGGGLSLYTLLGGVSTGLVMALLLYRAGTARRSARKWRMRFVWPARLLLLYLLIILLLQLDATGALPVWWGGYRYHFDRLAAAISAHYPYLESMGDDWEPLRTAYRERAAQATTDDEFLLIVAEMLARFGDGQAYVSGPKGLFGDDVILGSVERVEGEYVLSRTNAGLTTPELVPGTVILARDGVPIEAYLKTLPPWYSAGSSPQSREYRQHMRILAVPRHRSATFTVRTVSGEVVDVEVQAISEEGSVGAVDGAPAVRAEVLPSGIGYIEVTSFDLGDDVTRRFNEALDRMMDAPALIIDVRHNGGGSSWLAQCIARRFLADAFAYGRVDIRHRLPHFLWAREQTWTVVPKGTVYPGPVVVLTGPGTTGAGEAFVVAMRDSGRAVIIGRPTAGELGVPIAFNLPGGRAFFSVGAFTPLSGPPVKGVGVQPDIQVTPGYTDIVGGRDAALSAAVEYLLERV